MHYDIDAILFDFGGTLYDVSDAAFKCWQQILIQEGFDPIDSRDYYKAINRTRRDFLDRHTAEQVRLGLSPALSNEQWITYNQKILENSGITSNYISRELCSELTESMATNSLRYEILSGTLETLNFLSKYYKLGVISNTSHDLRHYFIRDQILSLFDVIVLSYEVGYWKPDVDIFSYACQQLGISPDRVAYVGDQPICDYYGALQASLYPILKDNYLVSHDKSHVKNDMIVISELSDLIVLLEAHHV